MRRLTPRPCGRCRRPCGRRGPGSSRECSVSMEFQRPSPSLGLHCFEVGAPPLIAPRRAPRRPAAKYCPTKCQPARRRPAPPRPRATARPQGPRPSEAPPRRGAGRPPGAPPALGSSWEAPIKAAGPGTRWLRSARQEAPPRGQAWRRRVKAAGAGCRLGFCCPRQRPDHRLITRVSLTGMTVPVSAGGRCPGGTGQCQGENGVWREKARVRVLGGGLCLGPAVGGCRGPSSPLAGSCRSRVWLLLPPQSRALVADELFMS